MRSSVVTVPSLLLSAGSVDIDLELVAEVLLVVLEEVALDAVVPSTLRMSGGGPGGGPPAGGAPCGGPCGGPAFAMKSASSDLETDPSPSVSMALKSLSRAEVSVLPLEVAVAELFAAA